MEWLLACVVLWLVLVAAALIISAPARRADEGSQRILARERILGRLDRVRSPSGRGFFATEHDRHHLVAELDELHRT